VEFEHCQHCMTTRVSASPSFGASNPAINESAVELSTDSRLQCSTMFQRRRTPEPCGLTSDTSMQRAAYIGHAGFESRVSKASRPSRLALQHVEQVAKLRVAAALACPRPQHLQPPNNSAAAQPRVPVPQVLPRHALHSFTERR
jgi:hypothetical protein